MVNLDELSAKELYELAQKKEQEEARLAQMQQQLTELKGKREQMIRRHEEELAYTDQKLDELTRQRKAMIESHQKALAGLDQELKTIQAQCDDKKSAARKLEAEQASQARNKAAATPVVEKEELPPPVNNSQGSSSGSKEKGKHIGEEEELDLLMEHIIKMMKGRSYISEGLMREKLSIANFKSPNLRKLLDTLVRQKRLVNRSGGNYVLGKGAKKR
jgi:hypothetical protein